MDPMGKWDNSPRSLQSHGWKISHFYPAPRQLRIEAQLLLAASSPRSRKTVKSPGSFRLWFRFRS